MSVLVYLIPISLGMGALGLGAFLWCLKAGQYEDLAGAAERVLFDDEAPDTPAPDTRVSDHAGRTRSAEET